MTMKAMKVKSAIRVAACELINRKKPEHIAVTYGGDGKIQALSWLFETSDSNLYSLAKRRGGIWNKDAGGWTFADASTTQVVLDVIIKKHPDWPIIGDPSKPFMPLAGVHVSRFSLGGNGLGFDACLVPFPLPCFTHMSDDPRAHIFLFRVAAADGREAGLLIGGAGDIAVVIDSMVKQGAVCDDDMAMKWPFTTGYNKLQVNVTGWAVQITCDLSNPLHYLASPEQKYRWEGAYPNGTRVAIPWTGTIHTTRKLWPRLKNKLQAAELEWEGDDPEADPLTIPALFNENQVAGWNTPAPNGYLLHAYQKEGARFCAARGMRALIGDEMGVGKTVQAIAAAEAVNAPRILVICPANARYVWEREIQGWGGRGGIQHIVSQLDKLDMDARWHVLTYDLIAARTETWSIRQGEKDGFIHTFPGLEKDIIKSAGEKLSIKLSSPLDKVPEGLDVRRTAAWNKIMQRLRGELLEQVLAAGPVLAILDEAHRVKNKDTKRTKAIQRIAAGETETQVLMLTGTPLRNNEHEAAVLLSLLDQGAASALSKKKGYTIDDVKDYLGYFMIRRTKSEVLPELPEKTRQRMDVGDLDPEQMDAYRAALDWANESYHLALESGASEAQARQSMQGGVEQARTALGIAKVRGGAVADLVLEVVENKGCCVVFCSHRQASDDLKAQLSAKKLRVAVVDGRTSQEDRATIVNDFQEGRLDVFIGGINAAGEAITLTRADTVIFVELDWVPAALLQAEDRIHRVGQRGNCQVIQLIARMPGENNLDEMMADILCSKVARIGSVLDEDTANIIAGSIQSELHSRLLGAANAQQQDNTPLLSAAREAAATDAVGEQGAADTLPSAQSAQYSNTHQEKRKRGRPKVYIDSAPPTATERSSRSVKSLASAGGKRVMLRLTPEAHEALKVIMALTGSPQETATINQAIIARKQDLLNASTRK